MQTNLRSGRGAHERARDAAGGQQARGFKIEPGRSRLALPGSRIRRVNGEINDTLAAAWAILIITSLSLRLDRVRYRTWCTAHRTEQSGSAAARRSPIVRSRRGYRSAFVNSVPNTRSQNRMVTPKFVSGRAW